MKINTPQLKPQINIPKRDYYYIDDLVKIFSDFNITKSDIEHWISEGTLWPSVVCHATPVILVTKDCSYFEYLDGERDFLASILPDKTDIIFEDNTDLSFEVQRKLKAFNGRMAKVYGLWKVSSLLYEDSAFIQPLESELRFSCLTDQFSQLEYVLEHAEVEKILNMLEVHTLRLNAPYKTVTTKVTASHATEKQNGQSEISITSMIFAIMSLLPSFKDENFCKSSTHLYKKLESEYPLQEDKHVPFEPDNLNKWKESEHFDLFIKFIHKNSAHQRQIPLDQKKAQFLYFSTDYQLLDNPTEKLKKQRTDDKRARSFFSLLELLPDITSEDIYSSEEHLQKKIYEAFWENGITPPFIGLDTLSRWKEKIST